MEKKPLKEHFEIETDIGVTLRTFDYIEAIDKYSKALEAENAKLKEVLKKYEQWEADLILESECWEGDYPKLTEKLFEDLLKIQELRNSSLQH